MIHDVVVVMVVVCDDDNNASHCLHRQDEEIPKEPLPGAMSQIRVKFMDKALYQGLRDAFHKRPIWSKNALRVWLNYNSDKLKVWIRLSSDNEMQVLLINYRYNVLM